MFKVVVYTSIVGSCDQLLQPISYNKDYDYICFVRKGEALNKTIGVWQIKEIPFDDLDNRVTSRFPKINPHIVLPEYDYSLWIDGNVFINSSQCYDLIQQKINKGIVYSGLNHWGRSCAYAEIFACVNAEKETVKGAKKILKYLYENKFPQDAGLYENNVILRKHNDVKIKKFDELWWEHYMAFSKRDQLTHSYCYRKAGLNYDYLLPINKCARNHSYFGYVQHLDKQNVSAKSVLVRKAKVIMLKVWFYLFRFCRY